MTGWIAISRDIFAHDFFAREPMSEREAWVWMIARAAWKDTTHRIGGDMVDVPRGTFFCTLRELQSAWGWGSDFRVRAFLKRLEGERMINANSNAKKTHITICNYDEFQTTERTENASDFEKKRTENALKEQVNNKQEDLGEKPIGFSSARGSRLPADWQLPKAWGDWAAAEGLAVGEVQRQADIFRDYWLSVPSAKGAKANWELTWRNWVRKALSDQKPKQRGSPTGRRQLPDGRWQSFDAFNGWVNEHV